MHPRRFARECVLQASYAHELSNEPQKKVLKDILDRYTYDEDTRAFITELFERTVDNKQWADKVITKHLENWDFDRVACIDRLILRQAICELYFVDDVPPKVSIAEAIEIAKQYSTKDSSGFVNGILDAVYRDIIKGK